MPVALSVYLDLIRFAAALIVVLYHVWDFLFPGHHINWPGPEAVIAFLVLSGFVVAYVTDGRDLTLANYTMSRLSRLWSVALPALGFGLLLADFTWGSAFAAAPSTGHAILHTLANALFLAQCWSLDSIPPLNAPFWSLSYEFWFYAVFGAAVYLTGATRGLAVVFLAVLAGPKIILLLPCWLLGVFLYQYLGRWPLTERTAAILWVASAGAALLLFKSGLRYTLNAALAVRWPDMASLFQSSSGYLLTDYPMAALIAANFYATAYYGRISRPLIALAGPIRICASYTPTIYLFHMPLLVLFADVLKLPALLCPLAMAASIVPIGYLTEHRRRELRAFLVAMYRPIGPARSAQI
jgi:peptidoglycan/LPS O-acetylase OafA/YrhL